MDMVDCINELIVKCRMEVKALDHVKEETKQAEVDNMLFSDMHGSCYYYNTEDSNKRSNNLNTSSHYTPVFDENRSTHRSKYENSPKDQSSDNKCLLFGTPASSAKPV